MRYRGTAGKFLQVFVPDVSEIFDSDLAGEITVSGEIAEKRKKLDALADTGIMQNVFAIGDQV